MIANALLASNGTKLKQLHISRNRVENKASYLSTYKTLEVLEIFRMKFTSKVWLPSFTPSNLLTYLDTSPA